MPEKKIANTHIPRMKGLSKLNTLGSHRERSINLTTFKHTHTHTHHGKNYHMT